MAHIDQPTRPDDGAAHPAPDSTLDLSAERFQLARHAAGRFWQAQFAKLVHPHLELSLKRVRRALRVHGWLVQASTCISLLVWASLAFVAVQTVAFATQPGGAIDQLVPTAALTLPAAWMFFRLQKFVIAPWISARGRDLRDEEITYLACASAIAQDDEELFRQAIRTVGTPPEKQPGSGSRDA